MIIALKFRISYSRNCQNFSVKGQTVSMLGFVSHFIPVQLLNSACKQAVSMPESVILASVLKGSSHYSLFILSWPILAHWPFYSTSEAVENFRHDPLYTKHRPWGARSTASVSPIQLPPR